MYVFIYIHCGKLNKFFNQKTVGNDRQKKVEIVLNPSLQSAVGKKKLTLVDLINEVQYSILQRDFESLCIFRHFLKKSAKKAAGELQKMFNNLLADVKSAIENLKLAIA